MPSHTAETNTRIGLSTENPCAILHHVPFL